MIVNPFWCGFLVGFISAIIFIVIVGSFNTNNKGE
jgi:hypothetical protein